jgi:peptidyl-prolyl cis-trans isomerase C
VKNLKTVRYPSLQTQTLKAPKDNWSMVGTRTVLSTLLCALVFTLMQGCSPGGDDAAASTTKTLQNKKPEQRTGSPVVATVDNTPILEDDIKPLMLNGVDRAIALDRYINKLVTASAAREKYAADADRALETAGREILSQLYLQRISEDLARGIQDADIERFYKERIKAEDYREYRVRYVLLSNLADAQTFAQEAASGDKKAMAKFKDITDQPRGWLKARDIPYGLGQLVSPMKPGSISKPVTLRNGYMVLELEDTQDQKPPELKDIKTDIKNILISEAVVRDVAQRRSKIRIELK